MPVQVLPSIKAFDEFRQKLLKIGFKELTTEEFFETFKKLNIESTRPQKGREVGFIFRVENSTVPNSSALTVYVWTTYLAWEKEARPSDEGWVLIARGNKGKYFAHPLHRTKNFLIKLARLAWIARWRVMNIPPCEECKRPMKIAYGKALKSRYWRCDYRQNHLNNKAVTANWDYGMPPKALALVKRERRIRSRYRASRRAARKSVNSAMQKRQRWIKRRPKTVE